MLFNEKGNAVFLAGILVGLVCFGGVASFFLYNHTTTKMEKQIEENRIKKEKFDQEFEESWNRHYELQKQNEEEMRRLDNDSHAKEIKANVEKIKNEVESSRRQ